jgi:hypothetical protein
VSKFVSITAGVTWTREESARFAAVFSSGGIAAAREAFPALTDRQLWKRGKALGIQRKRDWTPREDEEMRRTWGHLNITQIAKRLGRTPRQVYLRSRAVIGHGAACPQGFEYLSNACQRCGYGTDNDGLRRILHWGRVRVVRSYAVPVGGKVTVGQHIVDSVECDMAVEAWHKTESLVVAGFAR